MIGNYENMKTFFINNEDDLNESNLFNCCQYRLKKQFSDEDESIDSDSEEIENIDNYDQELNDTKNEVETDLKENFEINISSLKKENSNNGQKMKSANFIT